MVGFVDTGNVFARVTNIELAELRSAVGGGVRYKSPFGPIRLDIGFKVNRRAGRRADGVVRELRTGVLRKCCC